MYVYTYASQYRSVDIGTCTYIERDTERVLTSLQMKGPGTQRCADTGATDDIGGWIAKQVDLEGTSAKHMAKRFRRPLQQKKWDIDSGFVLLQLWSSLKTPKALTMRTRGRRPAAQDPPCVRISLRAVWETKHVQTSLSRAVNELKSSTTVMKPYHLRKLCPHSA